MLVSYLAEEIQMSSRLVTSLKKTAGRNSSGRITSFHRGGGVKRLFRKIDLKRTDSSVGIVEKIEYDPNRSSRIAMVRWQEGIHQKKPSYKEVFSRTKDVFESTFTASTVGPFYLSTLCPKVPCVGNGGGVKSGSNAGYVVVVMPDGVAHGAKSAQFHAESSGEGKKLGVKDVFLSAFSKGDAASAFAFGSSPIIPRVAVAGAKPAYFVAKERGDADGKDTFSLAEIGKWKADSCLWNQRIKRQAAISWHSSIDYGKVKLGLVGACEEEKQLKLLDGKDRKKGNVKADRSPVSYIIASHKLQPGNMVMNYNRSKTSSKSAKELE